MTHEGTNTAEIPSTLTLGLVENELQAVLYCIPGEPGHYVCQANLGCTWVLLDAFDAKKNKFISKFDPTFNPTYARLSYYVRTSANNIISKEVFRGSSSSSNK